MDFEQKQLLDNLIKQICKDCDIDIDKRHIVNHSMRTIDIIQLTNLGVFFNEIMAYGVHCSLAGLSSYQIIPKKNKYLAMLSIIFNPFRIIMIARKSESGIKTNVELCNEEDDDCVPLTELLLEKLIKMVILRL
nr:4509_t:CDS:2 [Entrophospora candida]